MILNGYVIVPTGSEICLYGISCKWYFFVSDPVNRITYGQSPLAYEIFSSYLEDYPT